MQFVKFFVWIFCLDPFPAFCGDYRKTNSDGDFVSLQQ